MTTVVSGTRRAIKELVDGTIRVQIDIDPRFRKAFFDLFPDIDAPVAIAPLVDDFEAGKAAPEPVEHAHRTQGALCQLAVRWCRDPEFLAWAGFNWPHSDDPVCRPLTQEEARALILTVCKVGSRKELDTVPTAGATFQEQFRGPFMEHLAGG